MDMLPHVFCSYNGLWYIFVITMYVQADIGHWMGKILTEFSFSYSWNVFLFAFPATQNIVQLTVQSTIVVVWGEALNYKALGRGLG